MESNISAYCPTMQISSSFSCRHEKLSSIVSKLSLKPKMNSVTPLSMLRRNNNNNNNNNDKNNNNSRIFIQDNFSTKYCYQRGPAD